MPITAEIIAIGDEILLGQTKDSNSNWLSQQLTAIGVAVQRINVIRDDEKAILTSLYESQNQSNIVIITGGLGPTKDDLTKNTLCTFFNCNLVLDQERLEQLESHYNSRGKKLNDLNKTQAYLPSSASKITNHVGTANGMFFFEKGTLFISLPGVPNEMKYLMSNGGFNVVKSHFTLPKIIYRTIKTIGIAESSLAILLNDWENQLADQLKLAYLPTLSIVKLRLSCITNNVKESEEVLNQEIHKLQQIIGKYIFTTSNISFEQHIVDTLTKNKLTIASAESCTGGKIGEKITSISGASNVYMGGLIAYSNSIKINELNIPENTLEAHGAVSESTIKLMAQNIRIKFNASYGIATSGIAGPNGGTPEKPVGTIWIAVATKNEVITQKLLLKNSRTLNTEITTLTALNLLRTTINNQTH